MTLQKPNARNPNLSIMRGVTAKEITIFEPVLSELSTVPRTTDTRRSLIPLASLAMRVSAADSVGNVCGRHPTADTNHRKSRTFLARTVISDA